MAQRELKVKVTADIDKALTKLLDSLKKTTYNIKVNVKQDSLDKAKKTLDSLGKKSTINVKTNVNSKNLTKLNNDLEKIGKSKIVAGVDVKVQDGGLGQLQKELNEAERKAEEVGNARISPIGVAAGLAPLMATLDQISDKILNIANQTIAPVVKDTWSDSMNLFDAQKTLGLELGSIGKDENWIAEQMKALNEYGKQSKYSVAEMTEAFGKYYSAGNENAMDLVKGIAGISSYASNASSAMGRVNTQVKQMTDESKVFNNDWNRIEDAIGGAAMKSIKEWLKVNKGFEYSKKALSEGQLEARDFKDAIIAVGNEDRFQAMATNVSTVSTALDNLKESLVTSLVGDSIDPGPLRDVFQSLIGIIKDFADEVPNFTKDIAKGVEFLKDTFGEAFKDFSAKDFLSGVREAFEGVAPVIELAAKALGLLTNNGKDTGKAIGNLVKFAAGWKLFRGLAQPVFSLATAGKTLYGVAKTMGAIKGGGFLGKLFGGIGGSSKKFNTKAIKGQALNAAKNIAIIAGVIGTVWAGAKSIESISKMDIDWGSLGSNLSATAVGLTVAGGYMAIIGKALDRIKGLKKNLVTGGVAVAGVAGVLAISAKAIEEVSKVEIDKNTGENLLIMAGVITVAGGAIALIGTGLTKFPQAAAGLAAGAGAFIGISATLALVSKMMESTVKSTVKIAEKLKELDKIDADSITGGMVKLASIQIALQGFSAVTLPMSAISAIGATLSAIGNVAQNLNFDSLMTLVDKITSANFPDSAELSEKLSSLQTLIYSIATFNVSNIPADIMNGFSTLPSLLSAIGNVAQNLKLDSLQTLANKINAFPEIDAGMIETKIKSIQSVIKAVGSLTNAASSEGNIFGVVGDVVNSGGKFLGSMLDAGSSGFDSLDLGNISSMVDNLVKIANKVNSLPQIDAGTVETKISAIKTAIKSIRDITINENASSSGGGAEGDAISFSTILDRVKKFVEIATALNTIPTIAEDIGVKVDNIKAAIDKLLSIGQSGNGEGESAPGAGLDAILTKVNEILTQLQALSPQFQTTGKSYAQSLVDGFNSGNVNQIATKVQEVKEKISNMADLTSIGKKMSDTLSSGFNADGLIQKINSIQSAINSLQGKTVTININEVTTKSTVRRANGGIIPEYHSTGGRVGGNLFKARGTDTVPAMLTPGEYVLKRSVSNALGKGFLDALNNMNLSSALAKLQNKVSGNNVTNNTYNNITQNVDNKASYLNGLGSIRRMVRL